MRHAVLVPCIVALAVAAGCSRGTSPPAPVSGLNLTLFDPAVRPQDDLSAHVNGGWLARTAIPADRPSYGAFNELFDETQEQLRVLVEEAAAPGGTADSRKIGDFYTAFMDEARADALGLQPLEAELSAIDALRTKSDVARHLARLFKYNVNTPIVWFVEGDARDPGTSAFYAFQGGLGLPDRDYYLRSDPALEEYKAQYVTFLTTILSLAGEPAPDASARDILAMETALAEGHWTNVQNRDAVRTYNKVPIADLPTAFPGFDWPAWIDELRLSDAPALVVYQPSYLKTLGSLMRQWPVDRWKPYLKAAVISAYAPYLSAPFVEARFQFYQATLQGIEVNQPRWKRAVNAIDANLGWPLGRIYVEKHFTPEAKARMDLLVENLRASFRAGIEGLDWMGPETKAHAQEKLAKFRPKVGYPTRWRDFSAVEVRADDLVGNVMRATVFEREYHLAQVGTPIDPEQWAMTPQTVNAYYNPVRNEIVFPAAILQPPFFNLAADDAVNYGAIGGVIGHEMGHGFDDQGRRYDGDGVLRDWWTEADGQEYGVRAQRLADYVSQFEALPGVRLNGALTLGENIGDLTGLLMAHRAYLLSLDGQPAPIIDGLTGDQRFFAGWAQVWRSKYREEALRQQVLNGPHAPAHFRGTLPLPHIDAFYRAFDVTAGDKLFLPEEARVRLW
jgi:putative endopeptidase